MNRRHFLKGVVATAAGVLVAPEVLAEPERRVFALDRTMYATQVTGGRVPGDLFIRDVPDWVSRLDRVDMPIFHAMEVDWNFTQQLTFTWGNRAHRIHAGHEEIHPLDPNLVWEKVARYPDGSAASVLVRKR